MSQKCQGPKHRPIQFAHSTDGEPWAQTRARVWGLAEVKSSMPAQHLSTHPGSLSTAEFPSDHWPPGAAMEQLYRPEQKCTLHG